MGVETNPQNQTTAPLIVGLQPSALVDHIARVDFSLLSQIPGDPGGSFPVKIEELDQLLETVKTHILSSPDELPLVRTIAGGSVANTLRGLTAGFGVTCGIIGACGDNEQGHLFYCNMNSNGVNLSRLRKKKGPTAQCVCLVDSSGNRTMRPCLSSAVKLQGDELTSEDFKGSKWLVMRFGIFNIEVIRAAIQIAKQEGVLISLDLASFEMVRSYRSHLLQLLESGDIDLCFANEDEASELLRGEENVDPEAALAFLGNCCKWAVVTLGAHGCIAKHGKEVRSTRKPSRINNKEYHQTSGNGLETDGNEDRVHDCTVAGCSGAGDLFASGFIYGLIKGLTLEECCQVGSCSGGSVIRSLGGEVTQENWQWMYKQMQIKGLPVPVKS
ncbi:hypothetical protein QQ045_029111 [Rhodiola kirilowii]